VSDVDEEEETVNELARLARLISDEQVNLLIRAAQEMRTKQLEAKIKKEGA